MADGIDFRALEKELEEAVVADEKYQRENEAKFRAVRQKVASYEEFRLAGFHVFFRCKKDRTLI